MIWKRGEDESKTNYFIFVRQDLIDEIRFGKCSKNP